MIRADMKSLNLSNEGANNKKSYQAEIVDTTYRRPTCPCGFWTLNDWKVGK